MNSASDDDKEQISALEALLGERKFKLIAFDAEYSLELQNRPPCTLHCPAGVNAKAYVGLISARRYEEAFDVISRNLPFPGVCGRVCTHPCEDACYLKDEGPIAIMELKRFAADFASIRRPILSLPSGEDSEEKHIRLGKKVAVVGAGPAGLTAAKDLACLGYDVTVFESNDAPGGVLTQGIPGYRLPRKVLEYDIESIMECGVAIETSQRITTAQDLFGRNFHAVVLAAGTMRDIELPIPGMEKQGVVTCLAFLRNVNAGAEDKINGKVLVLGGGSSAFDCARSAWRLGAEKVTIAYRRTENEMPANFEEIKEAREEGIEIHILAMPTRVLGEERVTGIEFLKTELGEPDETGRRRPVPIEGSEFTLEADMVITAIGFTSDIADFSEELELSSRGLVKVNALGQTSVDRIFAAGDVVSGPASVVEAVASGHDAAYGVHVSLSREKVCSSPPNLMPIIIDEPEKRPPSGGPERLDHSSRRAVFEEVNSGFSESSALKEACRCVRCGSCFECFICLSDCTYNQVMGTVGGKHFLIKSTNEVSKIVYDSPRDWKVKSGNGERKIHLDSLTAKVDIGYCIACGRCEESCAYQAVKVEIRKDSPMTAFVDHDLCRGCGACTGACPTGAISQGPMSGPVIGEKIKSLAKAERPLIFSCIWGRNEAVFGDDDVVFMCTRMIRPGTLIEALAAGISGVIVNPCHEDVKCHYLPFERSIEDVISDTQDILKFIGIDPRRMNVKRFYPRQRKRELEGFERELRDAGLDQTSITGIQGENRISKALQALMALSQISEKGAVLPPEGEDSVVHLALTHSFLKAEGFDGLPHMVRTVEEIFEKSIMDTDITQITIKSILKKLTIPRTAAKQIKIGLVPSSTEHGLDADEIETTLDSIEGVEVRILEFQGGFSFDKLNGRSKAMTLQFLRDAEDFGVDILVPLSISDSAVLGMFTRSGSWNETGIQIMDVLSFISHLSLEGGGGS